MRLVRPPGGAHGIVTLHVGNFTHTLVSERSYVILFLHKAVLRRYNSLDHTRLIRSKVQSVFCGVDTVIR